MNIEKIKKVSWSIIKDVLLALLVVIIVMGALFAYCQVWPPVVVVESGSMMHGVNSEIGIIDTGDMVLVKRSPAKENVMTFIEGESRNHRTYGEFGDVIIYRPNGRDDLTPIIHRAVLWLDINTTHVQEGVDGRINYDNYTFDVSELGLFDTSSDILLSDYGYKVRNVIISLDGIMDNFERMDIEPHGGYITMGDNNCPTYDQRPGSYLPVKEEWVVGKAFGELPWFGLIKLSITGELMGDVPPNSWQNLSIAILLLLGIPLFIDFGLPFFLKKDGEDEGEEKMEQESEAVPVDSDTLESDGGLPEEGIPEAEGTGQVELIEQIPDKGDSNMPSVGVIKEKETIIIKEIVKIPCSHCGANVENTESKCPSCGAPIR